tara:strand:- start:215 stop:1195 length:981 start_codon:yes stop_codon:yes gene_type:complete
MKYREFSDLGWKVSELGLGCWGIGGGWTDVSRGTANKVLKTAIDSGVNFFDTADDYGHGESEKIIGKYLNSTKSKIYVSTKIGSKLKPFFPENYNLNYLEKYLDSSLKNLQLDCIDLLQLHCPPKQIIESFELHETMKVLKKKGKILNYGISVFNLEEANAAINFNEVKSVQLVFNLFRQKPLENFLKKAYKKKVAIIARGPLVSGLLTGSITQNSIFPSSDHRNFNLKGKYFNISETFSGIPLKNSFKAINEIKKLLRNDISLIDLAFNWILNHKEITIAIPGATNEFQVLQNYKYSKINDFENLYKEINKIYLKLIKDHDQKVS